MSIASLKKSHVDSIDDSIEDFKAAFVCMTNGINGYFESPDDLLKGYLINDLH